MTNLKDLLNPNKILFHFAPLLNEYLSGRKDFAPIAVEIHPTSKCNHRCIHCAYKERNERRLELSRDVMDRLIGSVIGMGVKAVYFSGGGEPTVYPGLRGYIERLHSNGVEVSLITNGTYLEEAGIIDIAYMLNYIAVSVPSVNPDTFERITKSTRLDKVLGAPQAIKLRHGENAPVVGARVVVTNVIYKEVLAILNALKQSGYDYALFKLVRDYEDRGLGVSEAKEQYLREIIAGSKFDESYTNINSIFDYKKAEHNGERCIVNELGMIANIDSDGKVYPNIVEIGKQEFCAGDLNFSPLEEIWNGRQHIRVKEASNRKWQNGECKNCRAIAYNNIINGITGSLPAGYDPFI